MLGVCEGVDICICMYIYIYVQIYIYIYMSGPSTAGSPTLVTLPPCHVPAAFNLLSLDGRFFFPPGDFSFDFTHFSPVVTGRPMISL